MRIAVVSAGLSTPSTTRLLADELGRGAAGALRDAGHKGEVDVEVDVEVDMVELRPLAHELTDALLTGFPGEALAKAFRTVADADALVAVSPVFSASYSGLFKTFFDVLEPEVLAGKPVVLGATAGSARHSLVLEHAMRPLFAYLKAVPVPTAVFAAAEDFGPAADGSLTRRAERAGRELAALLGAVGVRAERRGRTVAEELAAPTPFAEVLATLGQ